MKTIEKVSKSKNCIKKPKIILPPKNAYNANSIEQGIVFIFVSIRKIHYKKWKKFKLHVDNPPYCLNPSS